jgi:hypothetical protein
MKTSTLWFSLLDRYEYPGVVPAIYPPNYFEWEHLLDGKREIIYEELKQYISEHHSPKAYFNYEMVSKPNSWKTIPLMSWNVKFYKHLSAFPNTYNILKQIPGLVSISFNVLEPNSSIKPHFGDTNGMVRCHFGLDIPGNLPQVGFRVKQEMKAWEEGQLLIFCDGYEHEAWNKSDKPRIILLFDVILPDYLNQKNKICGTVLSSIFFQSMLLKFKMKEPSRSIIRILTVFARFSAICLTPIYNLIGKIRYK